MTNSRFVGNQFAGDHKHLLQFFSLHALFVLILLISGVSHAQDSAAPGEEIALIRSAIETQREAWNKGDLNAFMQPYWQSDKLMFVGKSGVTYGWQATLKKYQTTYPDVSHMGKLAFDIISIELLSPDTASVIGKWSLTREAGDVDGHFSLLWKKMNGSWVIVIDHSS